jgi:tetratricopeptide (TPR) repeat protein
LWRLGRPEEAEPLIRHGRDDYGAAKGDDHPGRWIGTIHLAMVLRDLGRYDEAERELQGAETFYTKKSGAAHADVRSVQSKLSTVYLRAGRQADADRLMAKALDESQGPVEPRSRGRILSDRGEAWLTMGKPDAAEDPLLKSFAIYEPAFGVTNSDTQYVIRLLVKTYEKLGRPKDAARWRARLL